MPFYFLECIIQKSSTVTPPSGLSFPSYLPSTAGFWLHLSFIPGTYLQFPGFLLLQCLQPGKPPHWIKAATHPFFPLPLERQQITARENANALQIIAITNSSTLTSFWTWPSPFLCDSSKPPPLISSPDPFLADCVVRAAVRKLRPWAVIYLSSPDTPCQVICCHSNLYPTSIGLGVGLHTS